MVGATLSGCTSYVGIAKAADGNVYLTGSASYLFIFSSNWVKRCTENGAELTCETLAVTSAGGRSRADDDEPPAEEVRLKKKRHASPPPTDDADSKQGVDGDVNALACVA
ncbi:MAG: hypothetical protein ACHREM_13445 [Polyangiales bacterium]